MLSADERAHAAEMRSSAARQRYMAGRIALREVLSSELGVPPADVELVVSPDGGLALPRYPDLHLSLSHTEALVGAALSRGAKVGVDVEVLSGRQRPVPARALDVAKLAAVAAFAPRELAPLAVWVAQEAALKADGIGLGFPLEQVTLTPDATGVVVHLAGRGEWGVAFQAFLGGIAAVASRGSPPNVVWHREVARWLAPI
ncbi:MAG: hypothetical protein R3320_02410 [Nitriliruptorales bacterium]|nr:hypothetical protein [Nitriliruptorales bacterium]